MQDHFNLIYREEQREMLPLCREEKIAFLAVLGLGAMARSGALKSRPPGDSM
jgi:1-deoxyxylulose-5-phosphate synthase